MNPFPVSLVPASVPTTPRSQQQPVLVPTSPTTNRITKNERPQLINVSSNSSVESKINGDAVDQMGETSIHLFTQQEIEDATNQVIRENKGKGLTDKALRGKVVTKLGLGRAYQLDGGITKKLYIERYRPWINDVLQSSPQSKHAVARKMLKQNSPETCNILTHEQFQDSCLKKCPSNRERVKEIGKKKCYAKCNPDQIRNIESRRCFNPKKTKHSVNAQTQQRDQENEETDYNNNVFAVYSPSTRKQRVQRYLDKKRARTNKVSHSRQTPTDNEPVQKARPKKTMKRKTKSTEMSESESELEDNDIIMNPEVYDETFDSDAELSDEDENEVKRNWQIQERVNTAIRKRNLRFTKKDVRQATKQVYKKFNSHNEYLSDKKLRAKVILQLGLKNDFLTDKEKTRMDYERFYKDWIDDEIIRLDDLKNADEVQKGIEEMKTDNYKKLFQDEKEYLGKARTNGVQTKITDAQDCLEKVSDHELQIEMEKRQTRRQSALSIKESPLVLPQQTVETTNKEPTLLQQPVPQQPINDLNALGLVRRKVVLPKQTNNL